MVVTFSRCAVVTHWLPHTPVQVSFRLFLELKMFGTSFLFEYTNWNFQ